MMQRSLFEEEQSENGFSLWPHQVKGKEELREAVKRGHRRVVLQVATGGGKTRLMAEIILDALKKGSKVVFCVPLKALVDQTVKEFQETGIKDIGVIQAQHAMTDWMAPVQVASIQTLIRRPIPEADLIIWDECHVRSKGLSRILNSERWKDKVVIGLSATPWAKGMGLKWQELVVCGTTKELIESGVLCHYRIMVPPDEFKPNRAGVKIKDGEFVDEAAIAEFSKPAIVGNVVDTWMEHGPGYETFLFGQNCAHARSLQAEFNERGISCGYIDGESEEADILAMWKKYDSHEYKVIASVGCLVAGVDKRVRCIILAMMTKSRMKYMQIVGRSFRTNGDPSKVAMILDHGGNTLALGEPVDIQYDHLDMSKPGDKGSAFKDEKEPPKPRECPHCHHLIKRSSKTCQFCGQIMLKLKDNDIVHEDGELVEFGSGKKAKKIEYSHEEKQRWYSGFLSIAAEHGNNHVLAAHRYQDKFGVWPRGLDAVPASPSVEMRSYDKYCRIRYIKGKKANAPKPAAEPEYKAEF
jgi:superfamily II DNA or RNA helicase